jgi:hypothetical protein
MPRRQPRPPGRSADPRQHHIVPAFYLAGFTPTLDLDGALWVFRCKTTNHFQTSPRKACRERDYYRFHTSDESADDPFFMGLPASMWVESWIRGPAFVGKDVLDRADREHDQGQGRLRW